jgi:hypothetical protein
MRLRLYSITRFSSNCHTLQDADEYKGNLPLFRVDVIALRRDLKSRVLAASPSGDGPSDPHAVGLPLADMNVTSTNNPELHDVAASAASLRLSLESSLAFALAPILNVPDHYRSISERTQYHNPSEADWRPPLDHLSSHLWMHEKVGYFSHWCVLASYHHRLEMTRTY